MKNLQKSICFMITFMFIIRLFPLSVQATQVQIATYDLSAYCNQVEKSQEFAEFLAGLDEETPKILVIPDNQVLVLNHYFTLPSNTTLQGGTIEFVADSQYANVYNEAYIINRHSNTYWDGKQDENIIIKDTTLCYDCSDNGRSLIRFRNVTNFTITNCKIDIINKQKTETSHNAAIDLFKGCTNGMISNNEINLDNPNGSAGGAIWIRSAAISGNDPEQLSTTNIQVLNNTIRSNSCDELLAVGSSGFDTSDVLILGNTFIRENGSKKNLMLGVCPSTFGNISNVTIRKNIFYMNNVSPIMNKEIVRVGGVLDTTNYPFILSNITLEENDIVGNLADSKAIVVKKEETNGASVKIAKNSIKNTGESLEKSYGIIASGPNIVIDNQVEGVETPYALSEETRLQEEMNSREENRDLEENESQEEPQNQESTEIVTNSGDVNNNTNQTTETRENTESASEEARSGEEKQTSSKSSDKLKLKLKRKKSAITLKWKRVASAKGYVIYGARKGKKQKKIKTIKKGTTTSFTHKKLKSKKTYKYVVKAYTIKKGKKKWIAISKTCYAKTK